MKRKRIKKSYKQKNVTHENKLLNLPESKGASDIKISEAILRLSEPLRQRYREIHRIQTIISITVMAWNISLFPKYEQDHVQKMLLDSLPKEISGENVAVLLECIDTLIERKKTYYPNVNEYIVNYNMLISGDTLSLTVESGTMHGEIRKRPS